MVIFLDRFTPFSTIAILFKYALSSKIECVYYFSPSQRIKNTKYIRLLSIFGIKSEQVSYNIGQIEDGADECENESKYIGIFREIGSVCERIKNEQITLNSLIPAVYGVKELEKIQFHFSKKMEVEIRDEIIRVRLVNWITEHEPNNSKNILLIAQSEWSEYILAYAALFKVDLRFYHRSSLLTAISPLLRSLLAACRNVFSSVKSRIRGREEIAGKRIGLRYFYRTVSFDPRERSEFFWLHGSNIDLSQITLYDYSDLLAQGEREQVEKEKLLAQLREREIKVFGYSDGVLQWRPSLEFWSELGKQWWKIISKWLWILVKMRKHNYYYFSGLISFAVEYAYWLDFFLKQSIRVNVTAGVYNSVAQILALDKLDGISIAYQYSLSDYIFPRPVWLSAGEDIYFVFTDRVRPVFEKVGSPTEYVVPTGYLYSSMLDQVGILEKTRSVKERLHEAGAQYVICFFDENSVDRWDVISSHAKAKQDYEFLLNWLDEDPNLGLVIKPKKANDLFSRISPLDRRIKHYIDEGRCHMIAGSSSRIIGEVYPAEAALSADLCVGKTIGATAAFEASLIGIPTVMVNTEKVNNALLGDIDTSSIIFDDWASLRCTVEEQFRERNSLGGIGNWSDLHGALDPFLDGRTNERICNYISSLLDLLNEGKTKEEALSLAYSRYVEEWDR